MEWKFTAPTDILLTNFSNQSPIKELIDMEGQYKTERDFVYNSSMQPLKFTSLTKLE